MINGKINDLKVSGAMTDDTENFKNKEL